MQSQSRKVGSEVSERMASVVLGYSTWARSGKVRGSEWAKGKGGRGMILR